MCMGAACGGLEHGTWTLDNGMQGAAESAGGVIGHALRVNCLM